MMEATRIDAPGPTTGDDYLDTVALLQEEIARLEAELRLRDETAPAIAPELESRADAEAAGRRVADLTAALAERDETIALLWDHLGALEEVQSARAAEWEQLNRWVEELEERFEGGGSLAAGPDEGRREAEALRDQLETDRRAWESERRRFEEEVASLRDRLDEASGPGDDLARKALEAENRRLRDECRRLAALEPAAVEAAALRGQVHDLRAELEAACRAVARSEGEVRRERIEREAERAAHRASQAGERASTGRDLSPDERVRALRDHLREIHAREEQERKDRQLSSRLARLWNRSSARR